MKFEELRLISQQLVADYEGGMTLQQVGEKHGLSTHGVHARLERLGIPRRRAGRPEGKSDKTLALLERIKAFRKQGLGPSAIARKVHYTHQYVSLLLIRNGLS